jgi:2-dehydro-3-deoxyphosphogluconate aldolase/(4S)-4-hydroxy-2-oxoglutarate aldolase
MPEPSAFLELRRTQLIAAIRASTPEAALAAARAVTRGGVRLIEVTFTVPDAHRVIAELVRDGGDAVVGAGTVLTREQALRVVDAGGRFIVAPNVSGDVARVAHDHGLMYCPGAYTTGEIIAAMDAGAHVVKVYPVGVAGGPAYIRVIRDPLPNVPMLAAGGTNLENLVAFLEAGCIGIGLGAALADAKLAAAGDHAEITRRASAFVERVSLAGTAQAVRSGT